MSPHDPTAPDSPAAGSGPDDPAGEPGPHESPGGDAGRVDEVGDHVGFDPDPLLVNGPDAAAASIGPLGLLNDVDMEVTVELGRTTMPIRELLALQPGMVVEIERAAAGPIDVLVNGRLIARGEVVVIDEEFGVRVTEIAATRDLG